MLRFRLLLVALLVVLFSARPARASDETIADVALRDSLEVHECAPGPWGKVFWHYFHLEAPDWLLEYMSFPAPQTAWSFHGTPPEEVRVLLTEAGVEGAVVDRWLAEPRAVVTGPEATTLLPTVEDVVNLTLAQRLAIYEVLARFPQNDYHHTPVRILDSSVDAWLGKRTLREPLRELLKALVYEKNGVLLFSDPALLLSQVESRAEARSIMKLTTRIRGVMAYIEVKPGDDTNDIDSYWSAGFKRKDMLPILNSLTTLPEGGRLGLAHILPAESRKNLYAFPSLAMAARGRMPDCHWTSLNFFSHLPRQVYLDTRLATAELKESYEEVQAPYKFGDILMLFDEEGRGVHSCVWLCDQLVYTKNGETASAPWLISTVEDVTRYYSSRGAPPKVRAFRRMLFDD